MDKEKIDLEVYDKCVDASVALFMQYYCAAVSEDIHKEILEMQAEEKVFPETLDTRCRATIKKQNALSKRRKCFKSVVKGLRYAAVFAVVLLALASTLFMTVEAVRAPIIKYYIALEKEYVEIGQKDDTEISTNQESIRGIDWKNPLAQFVPTGYILSVQNVDAEGTVLAIYDNVKNNSSILFMALSIDGVARVDAENAQEVREILIWDYEGILVKKDGVISVTWGDDVLQKAYSIAASELTEAEVIAIAENFMQKIILQ